MSKKNGKAVVVYASAQDARKAGRPAGHDKWRLWRVIDPKGKETWLYAYTAGLAAFAMMRKQGWRIRSADVSTARIESALASMSEAERKALLQRVAESVK